MREMLIILVLCAFSYSCITTTSSLLANTTYNLQADTCIYVVDLNATINWTPKNYNVNVTIPDGGSYYNSEANIQVSTPADKCIDRNWTTINLTPGEIHPDSETKTFYKCANSETCPSFPVISEYLNPGERKTFPDRNITCIANTCPSPPSDYCFQNYSYTASINSTQRYQYTNSVTNTTIDIQFTVPSCPPCENRTVYLYNCTNRTEYVNVTPPMKRITPPCGTTTVDTTNAVIIDNTACHTPLTGTLDLRCGQSYTYGMPHNLVITTQAAPERECPACPDCPTCPVCSNETKVPEFNFSALLQYDNKSCSSTVQVCRQYFYDLSCSQAEADSGDLAGCISRIYSEKNKAIDECRKEIDSCRSQKSDLEEQYKRVKSDQDWVLWLIGGIILLITIVIGVPLVYAAINKAGLIENKRIMPNPPLEEKRKV